MAYNFTYINKLDQFGGINYTLILEDSSGIMPTIRNDKYFDKELYPSLNEIILAQEAQKDIDLYTQQFLDEQGL